MPYDIVREFEKQIADYAGSKYAVAVDSCTNALFLCCIYRKVRIVSIPKLTYPGVANSIIHARASIIWRHKPWKGAYHLAPHNIIDSALRFKKNMYKKGSLYCLSFHLKKHIPIGRGGMILTDCKKAYDWLRKARFDGRGECPLSEDDIEINGWNMYMTPDQASKGLMFFNLIKGKKLDDLDFDSQGYKDLTLMKAFK